MCFIFGPLAGAGVARAVVCVEEAVLLRLVAAPARIHDREAEAEARGRLPPVACGANCRGRIARVVASLPGQLQRWDWIASGKGLGSPHELGQILNRSVRFLRFFYWTSSAEVLLRRLCWPGSRLR